MAKLTAKGAAKNAVKSAVKTGIKTRAPKADPNILVIPAVKPRNHVALAAQTRSGGAHTKSAGAIRKAQELAVKKLLHEG